ncbi:MCP four helix bundle domain-containing protein [uncultured Brevibacillus sp.]|uniref:MCP four helix bundle domain-containing protein n=1 Tax=uncultured Brevibacillus sp. TaxID=169970 RepID=UPI00259299A6|nr:MCP four helix bundle domain-containing protein [uncultured Brevibacillus sp.]
MTIKKKVLYGFIGFFVLLLIIGGISIFQMKKMGDQSTEIKDNWVPSLALVGETNALGTNVPRLLNQIGLETDDKEIAKGNDQQKTIAAIKQATPAWEESQQVLGFK